MVWTYGFKSVVSCCPQKHTFPSSRHIWTGLHEKRLPSHHSYNEPIVKQRRLSHSKGTLLEQLKFGLKHLSSLIEWQILCLLLCCCWRASFVFFHTFWQHLHEFKNHRSPSGNNRIMSPDIFPVPLICQTFYDRAVTVQDFNSCCGQTALLQKPFEQSVTII